MGKEELALKIATFRFGVISDFVGGVRLSRGEKERLLKEKAARKYDIPGSDRTRVSRAAILLWLATYKAGGCQLAALRPKTRADKGTYKGLDSSLCMAIRRLKKEDCRMTVPVILQRLRHAKEIDASMHINLTSLYRFIKNERLSEKSEEAVDRRRFEAEFPNDIWQCDVMHGPMVVTSNGKRKSYLLAIMDDHSRLITHAQLLLSESYESLRLCLRQAIEKRGLPRKFYVDNGACYRAGDLEQSLALLGIALTHSRPYIPEGRGKIERWFRTVRMNFLPLHARHEGIPFEELARRLEHWVETYNTTIHSSLQVTPEARFRAGIACVRPAPKDLLAYFRTITLRRVKKDRTIRVNGRVFEVPLGLINKNIQARYHEDSPEEVEVYFEERSYGFVKFVDANLNARVGRHRAAQQKITPAPPALSEPHFLASTPRSGELFGRASTATEEGI